MRYLLSVEWAPQPDAAPPPIATATASSTPRTPAPTSPGVKTDDPKTNGCPPTATDGIDSDACPDVRGQDRRPEDQRLPADSDHDGIVDARTLPDVPGVKTDDPKTNGCPPDRDHDGIIDAEDACPDVPGIKTNDPKTNGCPPDPDRDKDGIPNEQDACPDAPGPKNADPKKNGCPRGRGRRQADRHPRAGEVRHRQRQDPAGERHHPQRRPAGAQQHPEIKHLRIEGHTDNVGAAAMNKKLSTARAASVVDWLVKHGVDALAPVEPGLRHGAPIDTNDTPDGPAEQPPRRVPHRGLGDDPASESRRPRSRTMKTPEVRASPDSPSRARPGGRHGVCRVGRVLHGERAARRASPSRPRRSAVFANGGFETGAAGAAPPAPWTVQTFLNPGITVQTPQTYAGLNLAAGGVAHTVILRVGAGPGSQITTRRSRDLRVAPLRSSCALVNGPNTSAQNTRGAHQNVNILSSDDDHRRGRRRSRRQPDPHSLHRRSGAAEPRAHGHSSSRTTS